MCIRDSLSEYKQITSGCWDYEGGDCSALLQGMIENKEKFAQIEGLFWGDIEQEEHLYMRSSG